MRKINAVLFQGQCSIQTDGLALVLLFKVGAERHQHFASFLWAINNLFFLTHYLLGWGKIGNGTVSGSPQKLLEAGEGSVRRRCILPEALPGRLFLSRLLEH